MPHRFFITSAQLSDAEVTFSAPQAHQIGKVLRLRPGDQVQVFDGLGTDDQVVELLDGTHGRVIGTRAHAPEPRTRVVAYPALLQRDKFELALQKLTEVGVAAIAPVIAARSQVRSAPDAGRLARWAAIVREAAEQCGRGTVPAVGMPVGLGDALKAADGTSLMAYERERACDLRQALERRPLALALFVGPEGGFTPEEAACAVQAGARLVTLGPRVLRAETASPLFAALALYEQGDLSWPA